MRERVDTVGDDLVGAARGAHDHRAAAREPLRNHQAEGFRLRARMDDDVARAHGGGRPIDEPRQSDAAGEPARGDQVLELRACVLAAGGVVQRAADGLGRAAVDLMEGALAEQHHELHAGQLARPPVEVVVRQAAAGKGEPLVDSSELVPHRLGGEQPVRLAHRREPPAG